MAGERPYVVKAIPSSSFRAIQSIPFAEMQSCVVGPGSETPHRAMIAGSPHAATVGDSLLVATRGLPPTVPGHDSRSA